MGCTNSVATDPPDASSPESHSDGSSQFVSEARDTVHSSLSQTVHEIRNQQIVAQRKITQSSMGFFTVPEEALRNAGLSEEIDTSKEENFKSGLVFNDVIESSASDPSKLFSIIKRGETAQFHTFVQQHYFSREAELHKLRGMWDSSPLLVAVQYGQYEIANFLLDHPPEDVEELNRRNEKGCTIALYAVMEGNVDFVKRLIGLSVQMNIEPTNDVVYNQKYDQSMIATPLCMAVINNHRRILGLLIDNGCIVDQVFTFPSAVKSIRKMSGSGGKNSGVTGMRPILLACAYGLGDVSRELIWRVCDFHVKDDESSNILHHLAKCKGESSDLVDLFKFFQTKSCIDDVLLTGLDENGDTPLHIACDVKAKDIAMLYLAEGADASKINLISGFTPLHIAIRRRDTEMVKLLLEYGSNPMRHDEKGNAVNKLTPLEMASKLPADSEIAQLVNAAATAWSKMRVPMLRKSIINLFPDAAPVEHITMPHSQETNVHVHKKNAANGSTFPSILPVQEPHVNEFKITFSPRPSESTSSADKKIDSRVPFSAMFAAVADVPAAPTEVSYENVANADKVEEFVPLDNRQLVEDENEEEIEEEEDKAKIEDDENALVNLDEADGNSGKFTKHAAPSFVDITKVENEYDEDDENREKENAMISFENALLAMSEFVEDTYNSSCDKHSSFSVMTSVGTSNAVTESKPAIPTFQRPTPPPRKPSIGVATSAEMSIVGAITSVAHSNPTELILTTSGGSGNLRRRSLKSVNSSKHSSNQNSISNINKLSIGRRLSSGNTANVSNKGNSVSAKPPLAKKDSFASQQQPRMSQTPDKSDVKG